MRKYTSLISMVAVLAMVATLAPLAPITAQAVSDDTLTGYCDDGAVYLEWGSHWDADANILQKAETYPNDDHDWYDLGSSVWHNSYTDYDVEAGERYWYRVRYHEYDWDDLTNVISVRCDDWYDELELSPTSRTIDSGERVTFTADGGDGYYHWSTSEAYDADQWGSDTYTVRFYNYSNSTQTRYVTVYSDGESERATVRVRPDEDWHEDLSLTPRYVTVNHGEYVTFYADGGDGEYDWESSVYGYGGEGSWYTVLFSNYSSHNQTQYVTVRSDGESERATITVRPYVHPYPTWSPAPAPTWTPTPYPYPTWSPAPAPTWTPNPVVEPTNGLTISQTARNVTEGQTGHFTSIRGDGSDTLQFTIVVENKSNETLTNARLTDILPSDLRYVVGSTTIDNETVSDGITSTGINLGTLVPKRVVAIRISAQVNEYDPAWGNSVVYNTAQVRADDTGIAVAQLPITLGNGAAISTASTVKTGAGGSVAFAALAGLAAALMYGLYSRSDAFSRRYELARVNALMRDPNRMNFARLI